MNRLFYLMKIAGIAILPVFFILAYSGLMAPILEPNLSANVFIYPLMLALGLFTFGVYNETGSTNSNRKLNIVGALILATGIVAYAFGLTY